MKINSSLIKKVWVLVYKDTGQYIDDRGELTNSINKAELIKTKKLARLTRRYWWTRNGMAYQGGDILVVYITINNKNITIKGKTNV